MNSLVLVAGELANSAKKNLLRKVGEFEKTW